MIKISKYNYDNILSKRQSYDAMIYKRVADLERAKVNNEQRAKLMVEKEELTKLSVDYHEYVRSLQLLTTAIDTEDNAFKTRRLTFVNELMTDSLNKIFPQEGLCAEIKCDFKRKNEAILQLTDKYGHVLHPDMCSGKLQQYLISFAAVTGIVSGLGINNVLIDEAFGVAAPEILEELGKVVQEFVKEGVRVLMISQQPGLYQDLPRREIQIRKDPVLSQVEIVSEIDY